MTADTDYEVCIIGAGLCGLNALFVTSHYLSPHQKVLLVDRRQRVGGMWVDIYPYVRLHQPHPMFTAGNIGWTLGKDRSYLANKREVLDHFQHCLNTIEKRTTVDELFGWEQVSADEFDDYVEITLRGPDGASKTVTAKRLIQAYGARIQPNEPLPLSSTRVHSVSPDVDDMRRADMHSDNRPIWIIGSGKTAMDTAGALITEFPGREINMLAGRGTYFTNRDKLFPTGRKRWTGGASLTGVALEIARRFDGTNEEEVHQWMRDQFGIWITPETGNYLLGVVSEAENTIVSTGLGDIVPDHLIDAVDRGDDVDLVLRSGATRSIPPGSWIVNCTGYLVKTEYPYEPYISSGGRVLTISLRSVTLQLPSFVAYFMTHLLFLNKISDVPLYAVDFQELHHQSPRLLPVTLFSMAVHNLSLLNDELPLSVFRKCGLDFNLWYPLPRQLVTTVKFIRSHRDVREHARRSLDIVRERVNVRCGPVVPASTSAPA